jgi:hypothetical protein
VQHPEAEEQKQQLQPCHCGLAGYSPVLRRRPNWSSRHSAGVSVAQRSFTCHSFSSVASSRNEISVFTADCSSSQLVLAAWCRLTSLIVDLYNQNVELQAQV